MTEETGATKTTERDPNERWPEDPADTQPVVFHGKRILTLEPTEEQVAVLIRLANFERNTKGDAQRMIAMINRTPTLVSHLFYEFNDWAEIEDGLADRSVKWQEIIELVGDVFLKWFGDRNATGSRTERRAATKRARRAATQ